MAEARIWKITLMISLVLILAGLVNWMNYDRTGVTIIPLAWASYIGMGGAAISGLYLLTNDGK